MLLCHQMLWTKMYLIFRLHEPLFFHFLFGSFIIATNAAMGCHIVAYSAQQWS